MLILKKKMKNKEKLELILERGSNPQGRPASGTRYGTNKTGSESKLDLKPLLKNESESTVVLIQNRHVYNPTQRQRNYRNLNEPFNFSQSPMIISATWILFSSYDLA